MSSKLPVCSASEYKTPPPHDELEERITDTFKRLCEVAEQIRPQGENPMTQATLDSIVCNDTDHASYGHLLDLLHMFTVLCSHQRHQHCSHYRPPLPGP